MKLIKQLPILMFLLLVACSTPTETTAPVVEIENEPAPTATIIETISASAPEPVVVVEAEAIATDADDDTHTQEEEIDTTLFGDAIINVAAFNTAGFVQDPTVVDCTLTDGTVTQCAQFVTKYLPDNIELQQSCPETLSDVGGIWYWDLENAGLYRLEESFWRMVSEQGYLFFDEDDNINIEDPGPAGPNAVLEGNNCIEIAPDETVELTTLIPLNPVMADAPTTLGITGQVGFALTSIPIFGPAPSVAMTDNMPALDTCGGHMDPGGWYHWHATATDIETIFELENVDADCYLEQMVGGIFAYAYDGFPIYGSAESDGTPATDLDECNGHFGTTAEYPDGIYHYHATLEFPNLPNCLVGLTAETSIATSGDTAIPGGNGGGGGGDRGPGGNGGPPEDGEGGGRGGQGGGRPDFAAAAEQLGVTEQALQDALGDPPPDFAAAAEILGVTEEALQEAIGGGRPPRGGGNEGG